ncbi:MAG: hypothetical protein ACTHK0_16030 [Ginsengibacter sp.]
MIGFIVPVKSKEVSKDWNYDNLLFERTARSICGQLDQNFRLIVVYHEKPLINFDHPNIIYLPYNLPILSSSEIEDFESYVSKYYTKDYAEKMMDKAKKIIYGCKLAKELGCTYLMGIDSDDLISNQLSYFVNHSEKINCAGWRINKGYMYEEGKPFVLVNKQMFGINGSTHIVRKDLVIIPDLKSNKFWDYNIFEAHGYTRDRIRQFYNQTLEEYRQAAIVYVIHKNNFSRIKKLTSSHRLKNLLKTFIRGKFLTRKMRTEFGLYNLRTNLT